jgi:hypothetical protein
MQALVRVQAHMLARIVVENRAADIAVEFEPYQPVVVVYHGTRVQYVLEYGNTMGTPCTVSVPNGTNGTIGTRVPIVQLWYSSIRVRTNINIISKTT